MENTKELTVKRRRVSYYNNTYFPLVGEIQLWPLEDEEDKDAEAIKIWIDENRKVLRYLFNTCVNAGGPSRIVTFDVVQNHLNSISAPDLAKLFKEHGISIKQLSHTEVKYINNIKYSLQHLLDL